MSEVDDSIRWQRSYDQVAVHRFLAEVEAERDRLLRAIAEAEAREQVARDRTAALEQEAQAALGALVMAAHAELAALEAEHEELVSSIRWAAEQEATRLLAAAQDEATTMRTAGDRMAGRLGITAMTAAPPEVASQVDVG